MTFDPVCLKDFEEALEMMKCDSKRRAEMARAIRDMRGDLRVMSKAKDNQWFFGVQDAFLTLHDLRIAPLKPDASAYREEALGLYRFSESSWKSMDTEHYSACGYDDAQVDRRDRAREKARLYMAASILLESQGRKY